MPCSDLQVEGQADVLDNDLNSSSDPTLAIYLVSGSNSCNIIGNNISVVSNGKGVVFGLDCDNAMIRNNSIEATTSAYGVSFAWIVFMPLGDVYQPTKSSNDNVWPVRGGN